MNKKMKKETRIGRNVFGEVKEMLESTFSLLEIA